MKPHTARKYMTVGRRPHTGQEVMVYVASCRDCTWSVIRQRKAVRDRLALIHREMKNMTTAELLRSFIRRAGVHSVVDALLARYEGHPVDLVTEAYLDCLPHFDLVLVANILMEAEDDTELTEMLIHRLAPTSVVV